MKQKILAGVLSLCMVVSLFPTAAFADEAIDDNGNVLPANPTEEATPTGEPTGEPTANPVEKMVAKIGEKEYATLEEAVKNAVDGDVIVITAAGTYDVPTGKNITVKGAVEGVVFDNIGAKNMGGANVTFENVVFDYLPNTNYTGLQHSGNLVYNKCTFNGQVFLYGESETFNGCTFKQEDNGAYNVWTYGAKKVTFNNCTFNSAGKSVLIYNEATNHVSNVEVVSSKFNASEAVDGKAAIEMDSSLMAGINLKIDASTTATGFSKGNISGNSLWNNKKGSEGENNDIVVEVAGKEVLHPTTEGNHSFGSWYTTKEPSCSEEGIEVRVCSVCNVSESRVIPATGHRFDVNGVCTVCGKTNGASAPSRVNPNTGVHF